MDACASAGLCVANTFFEHKNIYKYSYRGIPAETVGAGQGLVYHYYSSDFVVVRRSFLSSVRAVRVYRGAKLNFHFSDHHLVVATLKIRLRKRPSRVLRRDFSKLSINLPYPVLASSGMLRMSSFRFCATLRTMSKFAASSMPRRQFHTPALKICFYS